MPSKKNNMKNKKTSKKNSKANREKEIRLLDIDELKKFKKKWSHISSTKKINEGFLLYSP